MKQIYSTLMMLALMVAALSITACSGDDEEGVFGDEEEYFEITINGEKYTSDSWFGAVLYGSPVKYVNGVTYTPYGGSSGYIKIDNKTRFMFFVIVGYAEDWEFEKDWTATAHPNSKGTYQVAIEPEEYFDNLGIDIHTDNDDNYEVTSGNMIITKVTKPYNDFQARTEGTFNFTIYNNVNNKEYICSGKFMLYV